MATRLLPVLGRAPAVLGTVLILMLCCQFVVVAIDRVEHHLGIDHAPSSLAGTVVDLDVSDTHQHPGHPHHAHDGVPDHEHVADAALSYVLPAMLIASPRVVIPVESDAAPAQLVSGLSGCIPERPPKVS